LRSTLACECCRGVSDLCGPDNAYPQSLADTLQGWVGVNCRHRDRAARDLASVRRDVLSYNQMVVDNLARDQANRVFHALADATRRDILLRTLEDQQNVSTLARRYPMSFAAVQKHVAVLEGAGLVIKQRKGREQLVRGNLDTMRKASRLLEQLEAVWQDRIDRIGDMLADEHQGGPNT
jgi:DNA-binding transcriptional ArsR family regulator